MGFQDREKEMKFIVKGATSIKEVEALLYKAYTNKNIEKVVGASKDVYWHPVEKSTCDFVRLRYPSTKTEPATLTVKKKDKGYMLDRIEIDVNFSGNESDKLEKLQIMALGKPAGSIFKDYSVLFLNKKEENVSVYKVKDSDHIFLEIEAQTTDKVRSFEAQLKKYLQDHNFDLVRIHQSLYDLFILGQVKEVKV